MAKKWIEKALSISLMLLVACVMTAGSCTDDDDDDVNGGGNGNGDSRPSYTKYVNVSVTHCERVGSVLMIDYTVENKTSNDITIILSRVEVVDNHGSFFDGPVAIGTDGYGFNIARRIYGKGRIECHGKIHNFDPSNRATSVNFKMGIEIDGVDLSSNTVEIKNVKVVDNRVMEHGVQTNDLNLVYKVTSCKFVGEFVFIDFTVKNNTGIRLERFLMDSTGTTTYDNNGSEYNHTFIRFGENEWGWGASTDFAAGGVINGTVVIENVSRQASELSCNIGVGADNYIMNDELVRFITIPISR